MAKTEQGTERVPSSSGWRKAALEFAAQVKQARRSRQMTTWALAEQCQLSVAIVEALELGFPVEQGAVSVVCRNLDLPVPRLDCDPVHALALLTRQRREKARQKQYQLAALAGIAAKTLKEIERGYHLPNPETCIALLSVTALQLQPQDIAAFVSDPGAANEQAQRHRVSAEARINACQELLGRVKRPSIREAQTDDRLNEKPKATGPQRRLLFTLRVYRDESMAFVPAVKSRPE